MTKEPVVAILGATGAVGQEFIRLIEERKFPYSKLKLLASYRSPEGQPDGSPGENLRLYR